VTPLSYSIYEFDEGPLLLVRSKGGSCSPEIFAFIRG
jgi:hypothetical protein